MTKAKRDNEFESSGKSIRGIWDANKKCNICVIGIIEGRERGEWEKKEEGEREHEWL